VVVFACRKKKKTRDPQTPAPAVDRRNTTKETVEHEMTPEEIEELKQFEGLSPAIFFVSPSPYAILSHLGHFSIA